MGGINCHISHRRGPDGDADDDDRDQTTVRRLRDWTRLSVVAVAVVRKTRSFRGGEVGRADPFAAMGSIL